MGSLQRSGRTRPQSGNLVQTAVSWGVWQIAGAIVTIGIVIAIIIVTVIIIIVVVVFVVVFVVVVIFIYIFGAML